MRKNFSPIIKRLKLYKPDKVILFGSYAWGKPNKDSDIDLLVIKNTKQNHYQRIPKAMSYLNDIEFPFDVLVLTPQEVQNRLNLDDFFIQDIINKGKILYEKK
ncbi:nucleotidyltransferase domain-containing protein [Patescibacteria group bacterium]|nr:nucleotidyltransferase domain-containing protein [Patescibacteria group bacterium]